MQELCYFQIRREYRTGELIIFNYRTQKCNLILIGRYVLYIVVTVSVIKNEHCKNVEVYAGKLMSPTEL